MDRNPKGRKGKVHLWAAFKDNSVIHFGTVWNKLVFSVGFGNVGFWMNCGCYCCLAKPTVMLQIRCESLTPCLYQCDSSHSEWEIMNKCDWLFLICVAVNYCRIRNCFAELWCIQKLRLMWFYVIQPRGVSFWWYLLISGLILLFISSLIFFLFLLFVLFLYFCIFSPNSFTDLLFSFGSFNSSYLLLSSVTEPISPADVSPCASINPGKFAPCSFAGGRWWE